MDFRRRNRDRNMHTRTLKFAARATNPSISWNVGERLLRAILRLLAHHPDALPHDLVAGGICDAVTVLLALIPEALEATTVLPFENPKPMLLVLAILAAKCPAIRPIILSAAMYHGFSPLALKLTAILADVVAKPIDGVCMPLPAILGAIRPLVDSVTLLFPADELAVVFRTAFPVFHAMSMLEVFDPLATIGRQTFLVVIQPQPLSGILLPLSNENIAVGMFELAKPLGHALEPIAGELRAIGPSLYANAVPPIAPPLTLVSGPCFEGITRAVSIRARRLQLTQLLQLPGEVAFARHIFVIAPGLASCNAMILDMCYGCRRCRLDMLSLRVPLRLRLVLWQHVSHAGSVPGAA
mmetsp:Transcript_73089/g.211554  ORF Transcript_73089/g.211554 Transcript_73089/m.211554 type:complete len:354 (+) Transcript_73089:209-1270(+)